MNRSKLTTVLLIAAFLFVFFVGVILIAALALSREGGWSLGGDRVALIYIEGPIFDSKTTIEHLKMYADDSRVKAVLLRIDSPGGGVVASQEIYDQVRRLRDEKRKKVLVSMGSVAASGGYYVACGADRILANPGTITGSIGVIAEWVNYANLLKWAQLKPEVIKSGDFKDVGSPTREITPKEREYLQGIINQLYAQFVNAVVDGRKQLTREKVMELADGRVYTGEEALREGLIDEVGGLEAAIKAAAIAAGIRGEPNIVSPPKPRRTSILDLLTSDDAAGILSGTGPLADGSTLRFAYLWK